MNKEFIDENGFCFYSGKQQFFSTKNIVAIGIGAALYAALSSILIPVFPNTSFKIAIALLTIFGSIYGPMVGFFVGFIGHTLNDMLMYGSLWFSWSFLSAFIGFFAGLIKYDPFFSIEDGRINKKNIFYMYFFALLGTVFAGLAAFLGDVYLYGEPANKVWLQIISASVCNFIVTAFLGIPIVIDITLRKKKYSNLEIENEKGSDNGYCN